ncbi:DUF3891 family protein [Thermoactinomyces mirandus]|uniref:DUF3891 family protein n=1 Tax=Thermoactinomyces mirandus TaxID=2756294 RepID=A0A7W2ASU2_9BACL|nr:DUF3891 family protein [Thermoactinomyces mirandus]MBA4603772.1 DUF3891 family protein [Thermoactinomyces mirandus]
MIVRKRGNYFILVKQHDHGLVAGEIAAHINEPIQPLAKTLFAISHHDVGWEELDQTIRWNEEKNRPYDFQDYPLLPKLEAYTQGIARVVANDHYAGFLCSKHYASFFTNETDPAARRFREQELTRQHQLREYFTQTEEENIARNFRLLQFCDKLSLFICLSDPGENRNLWYEDGIFYQGKRYQWIWEDRHRLRISPNLFIQSFTLDIPYQLVDAYRRLVGSETYTLQVLV